MKVCVAVIIVTMTGAEGALSLVSAQQQALLKPRLTYSLDPPIPPPGIYGPPTTPKGMPYDFNWNVNNADSSNIFSHVEKSDGHITKGEYRVLLPDGRIQVVNFTDNGEGFKALVTYKH